MRWRKHVILENNLGRSLTQMSNELSVGVHCWVFVLLTVVFFCPFALVYHFCCFRLCASIFFLIQSSYQWKTYWGEWPRQAFRKHHLSSQQGTEFLTYQWNLWAGWNAKMLLLITGGIFCPLRNFLSFIKSPDPLLTCDPGRNILVEVV